jgi:hypothetical protein
MNHAEKIKDILSRVNTGLPILKIKLSGDKTSLRGSEIIEWKPEVDGDSFHENLVKTYAMRKKMMTNSDSRGYAIDIDSTLSQINNRVIGDILPLYSAVCFNSNPKRTKLYKQILLTVRRVGRQENDGLLNFIFDVVQYHDSVSRENAITHEDNATHRKNILKLLEIMEQKYGKPISK